MTKSSEVLRLAAEYSLRGGNVPLAQAWNTKFVDGITCIKTKEYAHDCGYLHAENGEETCMALCLAAAIAESEGD